MNSITYLDSSIILPGGVEVKLDTQPDGQTCRGNPATGYQEKYDSQSDKVARDKLKNSAIEKGFALAALRASCILLLGHGIIHYAISIGGNKVDTLLD